MPIYEYECESCGVRQEALQRMNDPHLTTCQSCGGALHRLISSPAFQFKGTGWYVTDYADKNKKKGEEERSESTSSDKESDSKKSDSKKKKKKEQKAS